MKRILLFLLTLSFSFSAPAADTPLNQLTAAEQEAGWQLLFDGKDASQAWRGYKKDKLPEGWVVEEGALVRKKGGGDIITKDKFDTF